MALGWMALGLINVAPKNSLQLKQASKIPGPALERPVQEAEN